MKKFVFTALIAAAAASSFADDRIERQVYNDANFAQNRAKAVQMLEQRGYQVRDIEADDHWGKPVLEADAYKNGQEYDIVLSYPDLKIIKEKVDR
ncbi:PepSY domain-containing protein [Neisseria bacilliformis]|uniref:PepSY domain-containing protein n=1 Tax=Neisseria bacilliformis TaxID=267212 RepID=UPI0006677BBF|nr:PepSY domain-containing protein [Neisseria bacilliformis]